MKRLKIFDSPHYNTVVFALCFLMILFCLGFCSTAKTIFLAPITSALNISRSAFSVSETFRFIFAAIVNAFFGILVNRFGTKRLILTGLACLIASSLLFAYSTSLIGFYFAGALLGTGFSWTTTSMVGSIIRRRATKKVGTIMGIVLAANGFGGTLATNMLSPIIKSGVFGYKKAYLVVVALVAFVFLLFLFLYKDGDKSELRKDNKTKNNDHGFEGISLKEALRRPYFYLICLFIFLSGLILQGLVTSYSAILDGTGLSSGLVTAVLSIYTFTLAFSKILCGALYDKFGLKATVILSLFFCVLNLSSLLIINDSPTGRIIAVISSLFFALSLPLETVMLPFYAGSFFGLKAYNDALGIFVSVAYAGMALGPPIMNVFFDISKNYTTGIIAFLFATVIISVIFLVSYNLSNKHKKELERM
ncbi:MAG: MFS transporter [Clostridia bacterium]|nr:MFS transporter [Clostridia bacterium]